MLFEASKERRNTFPRGEGGPAQAGSDEERRNLKHSDVVRKKAKTESFIRFIWVHSLSHCIAIPHPPQCAHWGTFPSGEGISAAHHTAKLQFTDKTDMQPK